MKKQLIFVEILSPEANLNSSHKTNTTSFRRCAIAEANAPRDFLLKTGLKSDFGPVEPEQGVAKSSRAYAVSSDKVQGVLSYKRILSKKSGPRTPRPPRWPPFPGNVSAERGGAA
jgi:hypothetical protein